MDFLENGTSTENESHEIAYTPIQLIWDLKIRPII
jgi:hypothetical protein